MRQYKTIPDWPFSEKGEINGHLIVETKDVTKSFYEKDASLFVTTNTNNVL